MSALSSGPGNAPDDLGEEVCLLVNGKAADVEDGVVDGRHHVQDLVQDVGHFLRREVRRGRSLFEEECSLLLIPSIGAQSRAQPYVESYSSI